MASIISEFRSVRPAHVRPQAATFEWLRDAHTQAELTRAALEHRRVDEELVRARMHAAFQRFGCGEDKIASRAYELADCEHTRWADAEVYRLHEAPRGVGAFERTLAFERIAGALLERMHEEIERPPSDLLHVTCTGYAAPSPAQRLVARRGWGTRTRVTHAYHMGCYAAFPALRLARGAGANPPEPGTTGRAEVVHTELCSLHIDPANHEPEQLVVQSLFADGAIAYDVADEAVAELRSPGFELVALLERVLPDSASAMTWRCSESGMLMTLARDVPVRLAAALGRFVTELAARAELGEDARRRAAWAVHPGGPRILDRVQDAMSLEDEQLEHSRRVMRARGNMSSATLPHIWMEMAKDARLAPGTHVVSLAFGPGLTICGAVLRKVAP